MSQKGGDRAVNAIQAQAKQAVARYLWLQWQWIRRERNRLAGRLNEFIAKKQIVLHELTGARMIIVQLWGSYALESKTLHQITDAIDRTSKRIKLLKPRQPQPLFQEQKSSLRIVGE